jgi:hypothetical protein
MLRPAAGAGFDRTTERGAAGAGLGGEKCGAGLGGENERGAIGAGLEGGEKAGRGAGAGGGVNERGATGAGLAGGESGRGAGGGGGENERGAIGSGVELGPRACGVVGGRGEGELENVRRSPEVEGEMGRGTSAGVVVVGGNTDGAGGPPGERRKADDCTGPGVPSNARDPMGRAGAVDCANEMARASCEARVAGTASAGTCASDMEGPREAVGPRYGALVPLMLAVAAMYGRVRGAMTPTRSEGTMYPRTRGENTYLDEQNT